MKRLIVPAAMIAVSVGACARTVAVQNPQPIQAAEDYRVTEDAIRQALDNRGWVVQEHRPGAISALLIKKRYRLLAQINYDQRAVFVSFVGSQNLKQQQRGGIIYVHHRVNTWLGNLQRDIGLFLSRSAMTPVPEYDDGPPPPPPATEAPGAPPPGY